MSSLTSIIPASASQQTQHRLLVPTTQPIPLLTSDLVKPLTYAQTAGILLYYYLRSGFLIADPLSTLLQDIIPIAITQALFCAACLPSAGNWYSGTGDAGRGSKILEGSAAPGRSAKSSNVSGSGSIRRRAGQTGAVGGKTHKSMDAGEMAGGSLQSRILPTTLSLILTIAVPPVPLAVLALVLGAPLYPTYLLPHTMALSVHVALLMFLPIFYTHGVSATAWRDVAAAWLPFDEASVWGGAVGCMVGGWIGAVPMALDWDREWQKWPCTVLWGAVLGWGVGRLLTGTLKLGIGKRINLSEGKNIEQNASEPKAVKLLTQKTK